MTHKEPGRINKEFIQRFECGTYKIYKGQSGKSNKSQHYRIQKHL
jgi:hypothetical protein